MRRRTIALLIAAAAAAAFALAALLPPRGHRLGRPPHDPREMGGSLHVHTNRSDGTGTIDEVAAAASRAGLQFVVVTDHGDATRPPDPPQYRSGVLCLDAVEISTSGGHYIAVGLDRAAPYRLAGEPRDVIEDVSRLGGFGIVAHPDSAKPELAWREWLEPFDAIEWLNADSEWRDEPPRVIARAILAYPFRPAAAIASVFGRPAVLSRWDAITPRRRVVALAGHDAHARVGLRGNWEPSPGEYSLAVPSYEAAFRTFSLRARLAEPPSGDPRRDADLLVRALRAGHVSTVLDALASPGRLRVTARAPEGTAEAGDDLVSRSAVTLHAETAPAPGVSLVLFRNGRVAATSHGAVLTYQHQPEGGVSVYRVEARLDENGTQARVPWIVSNPLRILPAADRRPAITLPPGESVRIEPLQTGTSAWTVEHNRGSASLAPAGSRGMRLGYELAPGPASGQYAGAALTFMQGTFETWDRLRFLGSASREMRLSVQVRDPREGRRWIRSVVLTPQPREIVVRLDDMRPVDEGLMGRPPRADLASLLFVVDTTHTLPGTKGTVEVDQLQFERESRR